VINFPTLPDMGGIDLANGVVGAVLGMLFAVLFQHPIQNSWYRLRTRSTRAVRNLRQREESSPAWRTFSLGPLHTSALIVEGDGESPIPAQAVYIQVLDQEIELPSDMADWWAEIEEETRAGGQRAGHRCGTDLDTRSKRSMSPGLLSRSSRKCICDCARRTTTPFSRRNNWTVDCPTGQAPRSRYLDPGDPLRAPAFLQCSFAVNIAVVTADDMLVVSQRSNRVRMAPGVWNSSVNEGMSRHIDSSGRSAPDLYAVARRGMREELSIEPHEYSLELLAFVLDTEKRHWSAHFYAKTEGLDLRGPASAYEQGSRGPMGAPDHRLRAVPPREQ
jgi:hypothetical protein